MKSDGELRQDVLDALARMPMLQADDMDVGVLAGVVTLTGKVGRDEEKWNVEDAVHGLQGIKRVINGTRGVTQAPGQPPQADIVRP